MEEAEATVLPIKTGEPALATRNAGGRAKGHAATRLKVVVKRPRGGGGDGGGNDGNDGRKHLITDGGGGGGESDDDDDDDLKQQHHRQQQQQQQHQQVIIIPSFPSSATPSTIPTPSSSPPTSSSQHGHDDNKSRDVVDFIKMDKHALNSQHTVSEHLIVNKQEAPPKHPVNKQVHHLHNINVNQQGKQQHNNITSVPPIATIHKDKGKEKQRVEADDHPSGDDSDALRVRQRLSVVSEYAGQSYPVKSHQNVNGTEVSPASTDNNAATTSTRASNGLSVLAEQPNAEQVADLKQNGNLFTVNGQNGAQVAQQQTNGDGIKTPHSPCEVDPSLNTEQTDQERIIDGKVAPAGIQSSKTATKHLPHEAASATLEIPKSQPASSQQTNGGQSAVSGSVTEVSSRLAPGISSNGLFYMMPPPQTSANDAQASSADKKGKGKLSSGGRRSSPSSTPQEQPADHTTSTPTKRPVHTNSTVEHPLVASNTTTCPPTPRSEATGTDTPVSGSLLAALNDSVDDVAAGAQVLTDEQLWALKLPAGPRQVLDLILNNLSFVRPDSPAYESAVVIKSLVLIAVGFGVPIVKLAATLGQDWRESVPTLGDLKITKVAKESDDIEDDVVASARPFDGVIVEIETTKITGASAKKWILKSQPDLVHTTLTPNSMVSLPEVLIEPYNPIGTFLETLAWRGLVVDEKSGKLYRPTPAVPDKSLQFVTNEAGVELVTPLEPVFHATSRSSIGIFSPGVTPLQSFNPLSSPFARIREPPKAATGIWGATTQPILKKRVVERIRCITQGACSARIVEDLLGFRGKVQEAEGDWTGGSDESGEDSGLGALRGSLSEAAQFAQEVKNSKKGKKKGNSNGDANGNTNGNGKKGKGKAKGGYNGSYPPPPGPSWGYRGGGRQPQWAPPMNRYPYNGRVPPHLLYGYGANNNRFAQPPLYGMMQPPYPLCSNGAWPGYPPVQRGGGGGGWAPYGASRGGFYGPQGYPPMPPPASPPSPLRDDNDHGSVSASSEVSGSGVAQLVDLDDDDDVPSSVGDPVQQRVAPIVPTAPNGHVNKARNTAQTMTYGLGGEHWIRRFPSRVRALLVWTPNTFLANALAYRVWSPLELLGFAVEMYTAAVGIENVVKGNCAEQQLARLFIELRRREAEARGDACMVELGDDEEGEYVCADDVD